MLMKLLLLMPPLTSPCCKLCEGLQYGYASRCPSYVPCVFVHEVNGVSRVLQQQSAACD